MKNKKKKQVEALEVLEANNKKLTIKNMIPENTLSEEAKNELNKIKEIGKTVARENLYYRTNLGNKWNQKIQRKKEKEKRCSWKLI